MSSIDKDQEIERLKQWIDDLQSLMFINCVYCGHRYGPDDEVPSSMAQVLKDHVEQCPKHPMSKLKSLLTRAYYMFLPSMLYTEGGIDLQFDIEDELKLGED